MHIALILGVSTVCQWGLLFATILWTFSLNLYEPGDVSPADVPHLTQLPRGGLRFEFRSDAPFGERYLSFQSRRPRK